ncbi:MULTISPECIES: hypothetical protein [unclassified Bradyrhizobium]|uniref:hypothetical protein n=1 Tax=unclassified Bradyrhizobium TaxID=2631580 RepID=UPI002478E4AD|nr:MULTISPECIES: hypothetical protein [unclassified Bradyrhizobium]WGS23694.1 hypothetical protein MTX22_01550 [Bradyrhizobium sp. ISRA463]WGS31432.1 hypothetical protein MTX19_38430 [Bradyrhizobium sp. ISRA464]
MMNAFGRAIAALGAGIIAVGHWFWVCEDHPCLLHGRVWEFELYTGIFLIGVGVHALASWYWFDHLRQPNRPAASSVREPS